ncbi:MAG: AAA family ATPase [Proteobacteria bacterium]|nr:AAA family ATPase [Pseudomonadota bacterium]
MLDRPVYLNQLSRAVKRSPITALVGPRQCGKTTLARIFAKDRIAAYFDLESQLDLNRLQNPQLMLNSLSGLVIIDEVQVMPELFRVLRVLVDRPENKASVFSVVCSLSSSFCIGNTTACVKRKGTALSCEVR